MAWLWIAVLACGPSSAPDRYALTGTVVEVREDALLVAHDDIPGFMDAMTMPLPLANPTDRDRVGPGDTIRGTLLVGKRTVLTDVVVTARSDAPVKAAPRAPSDNRVAIGEVFPPTDVALASGRGIVVGARHAGPLVVTFLYTRCPLPEYCPLVVRRLLSLQEDLPEQARLLAITIDPEHDTLAVLKAFGASRGAVPGRFDFGRVPKEMLVALAERAGLSVHGRGIDISHDLVMLVIGPDGRLVARYGDMTWDRAEVLALLGQ